MIEPRTPRTKTTPPAGPAPADRALADVALKNADFERLKAMLDADYRRERRPRVGVVEVLGISAVGAALMVSPVGEAMVERVVALAAPDAEAAMAELPPLPVPPESDEVLPPEAVEKAPAPKARPHDLPAGLARAVAVVYADGRQVGRGKHFDVRLPAAARKALRSVGVPVPPRSASAATREAALVAGLGRLVVELGSIEAALACLRVDRGQVESALDLAYASNLRHPHKLESFARYLPPAARRAAEGPTRHVMALALGYDMQWPVPEVARVSSGFGTRIHPVLGEPMWHGGTDLAVEPGTPIRAMSDGFVVYSKRDWVNGKFVKLDHGYGLTSAYVHNSRLLVREGEQVKKGQIIALSGQTGRATGPHLHFQIEIDERPIDPEAFRERKAPRAHHLSIEAEAIGEAHLPH